MSGTLDDFDSFRARMNDVILGAGNLTINRFFSLDRTAYEPGALGTRTKEMLGLVPGDLLGWFGRRGQHRDPALASRDVSSGGARRGALILPLTPRPGGAPSLGRRRRAPLGREPR